MAAMEERADVVVAGFGPCGATLTALLGQAGLRVLAVDRESDIYDKPRAFALDHEIMRVFQGLGIAGQVSAHTAPFTPSEYYGADGRLIKRLGSVPPPWPQGWPPNLVFTQPPVERLLRGSAAGFAGVEVALGESVAGFTQSKEGVRVALRGASGAGRTVAAQYLIGCDGASSTVRRELGVELEDLDFDEPWLVVDVLMNEAALGKVPAVSVQYCDPARPATYLIGPGAHRRWEIMLLPGEDRDPFASEEAVWRLLARWIAPGDATLWRHASYRFHALVAREWRRGRVFLAGDAAHQQPPFTGQGMCQGVRDAANLAWKLGLVLAGRAGEHLLDSYGAERAPHVRRLTSTIKDIGRLICERDPESARRRDERLIAEAGGTVSTMPRQQLIPPLREGLLSASPHAANGTLFPQPRVVAAGRETLMDDATRAGFRLVLKSGAGPAPAAAEIAGIPVGIVRVGGEGGELPELDGVVAGWFERHACAAALLRPDHYVFGVAEDARAAGALLRELEARILDKELVS
jgi:3-(3-hydroxy-phenyl)propionate hydroxylase